MFSIRRKPSSPDAPRAWSIAGRLATIQAWKTLVLVATVGGVLYWGLARELRVQDAKLVASKLTVLEHLVSTYPVRSEAITSEVEHEAGDEGPLRYFLRVLDSAGTPVLETPGMPRSLTIAAFPAPTLARSAAADCTDCTVSADGRFLLASLTVDGLQGSGPVGLQVALDVGRTAGVLGRYAWMLVVVLGLGVILSAYSSLLLARRAVQPLLDISGRVRAISASHLDLPALSSSPWPQELQGLASDFDAMLARLGEAFTRLSQFAADLAHALRNPINNLRGSAEVALARPRTPEEYQQTLGSNLEELERLSRLIDGLLFIARSEDPRQAIERTTFPVRRELTAVQDFYEALAAERGVQIRCEGDATIVGDPMLVRRAVSNLLANALRHTPRGGTVVLLAHQTPAGPAHITVRDDGSGIGANHLPHVFERFYRADESGADSAGAGIGLSIVRSVMRLHGGEVRMASEPGSGTTVTLEFPWSGGPAADASHYAT